MRAIRCHRLRWQEAFAAPLREDGHARNPKCARLAHHDADRAPESLLGRRNLTPFADPRGLTAQRTQVVELGAPDAATDDDLDVVDCRGVDRECPLHPDPVADLTNGKGLACAAALAPDHDTLEDLDT